MRTLAERLAAARAERAPRSARPGRADRRGELAVALDGAVDGEIVVIRRAVPLPAPVAERLAGLPQASYFDTETTGLSTGAGTVIFLAAVGRVSGERLEVTQLLLPDYPHEPSLLRRLAILLAAAPRLVTYNGRGFDMPMLLGRLTVHALHAAYPAELPSHDDLLPVARRLWRRPLGGARLADVEAGVLGVVRHGDCPGAEVPMRFFAYLRGEPPAVLRRVVEHNRQDVVSLALLESHLAALRAGGWRRAAPLDPRGMALELLRLGRPGDAIEVLESALDEELAPVEGRLLRRDASRLLVACGEPGRAESVWRSATRRASVEAADAWVEIARIRERQRGDLAGALEAAQAASRVLDLAFALGRGGGMLEIARARVVVEGRRRRLARRVAAAARRCGDAAAAA